MCQLDIAEDLPSPMTPFLAIVVSISMLDQDKDCTEEYPSVSSGDTFACLSISPKFMALVQVMKKNFNFFMTL